jgi:hypothetical protein
MKSISRIVHMLDITLMDLEMVSYNAAGSSIPNKMRGHIDSAEIAIVTKISSLRMLVMYDGAVIKCLNCRRSEI